jgi:hypothetical protein
MALKNNPSASSGAEKLSQADKLNLLKETKNNIQNNLNNLQKIIDKSYKKFITLANTPTMSSVHELAYHCRERKLKFPDGLKSALPKSTLDKKTGIRTYEPVKKRELTETEKIALKDGYVSVLKHIKYIHDKNTLDSHKKVYKESFGHTGIEIQTSPDGKHHASSPETDSAESNMFSMALNKAINQIDNTQKMSSVTNSPTDGKNPKKQPSKPTTTSPKKEPTQTNNKESSTKSKKEEKKKRWSAGEKDKKSEIVNTKNKSLDDLFKKFKENANSSTKEEMQEMYKSLIFLKKSNSKIVDDPKYKSIKKWLSKFIKIDKNSARDKESSTKKKKPSDVESPVITPKDNSEKLKKNIEKISDAEIRNLIDWANTSNLKLEKQGFKRSKGVISCIITNLDKSSGKSEKYQLTFNKKDKTGSIRIISGTAGAISNLTGKDAKVSISSGGFTKKVKHEFENISNIKNLLGEIKKTNVLDNLKTKFLSQTLKDIDKNDLKQVKELKAGNSTIKINQDSIKEEGDLLSFSLEVNGEKTKISLNNKSMKINIGKESYKVDANLTLQGLFNHIVKDNKKSRTI